MQAQRTTALLWVSSSLGLSMAISIFHWSMDSSWPFAGTGRFLADSFTWVGGLLLTCSELVEGTGSELSSWLQKKKVRLKKKVMILRWALKMWSVMYVNEWQETSNMAGNWHRQWTTTELVQCPPPPPWSGSCQRWHVLSLTTNFCTSMSDRDQMRENA